MDEDPRTRRERLRALAETDGDRMSPARERRMTQHQALDYAAEILTEIISEQES